MKAQIAPAGEEALFPLSFYFFLGLKVVKCVFKKNRISAGFRFSHAKMLGSCEMVPFLRGAMRVIYSLGCEGAMRAIA
jgi:hypothetical protein